MKFATAFSIMMIAMMSVAEAFCATPPMPREQVIYSLKEKHNEQPIGAGMRPNMMYELHASKSGSFTVVASFPNGTSCVVAAGENWQSIEPDKTLFDPAM